MVRSSMRGRERGHGLGDLDGQLTGGDQDEGARRVRRTASAGLGQRGQRRQRERDRLAAAGAAAAEDVATRERVGQRRGLDREGGVDAALLEGGDDAGRDAEVGKGHRGVVRGQRKASSEVGSGRRCWTTHEPVS